MGRRMILFWGRRAENMVGLVLLVSVGYTVMMQLIGGFDLSEGILKAVCFYVLSMACVFTLTTPMAIAEYDIPLTISMGARRKNTFWGIQFQNLLYVAEMSIFIMILLHFATRGNETVRTQFYTMVVMALLLTAGVGMFAMGLSLRFGKKGGALLIIGMLVLGGVTGIGCALKTVRGGFRIDIDVTSQYGILFLISAGILYLAGSVVVWICLRKYEVRR